MIVVTGAAGFIGSCLVKALNEKGHTDIVAVDNFDNEWKNKNLAGKKILKKIDREEFAASWFENNAKEITFVFHIGARTDTTEFNKEILDKLNFIYTQKLWKICTEQNIPIVYASSAATYGLGEFGYDDDELKVFLLQPLNAYGESKNEFDKWALLKNKKPPYWVGLKFFNVYGPNEYHKGRMASVIFHAFKQVKEKGIVKLFRSHNPEFKDGEQLRDFIYVKDVLKVCLFLLEKRIENGIYNLGTGKARTFVDLAKNTFKAAGKKEEIEFIDTPEDIRNKYQYFTEATMDKIKAQGYSEKFYSLEEGIEDYVKNYLATETYF
ncbi:MAG: ADP-glyceromanno-heptose 6-epimerase [Bacteroidia bacterium]|nr:ADP-glyceromanno-heptose 6-epimerase [Bacteroidia bacterium]